MYTKLREIIEEMMKENDQVLFHYANRLEEEVDKLEKEIPNSLEGVDDDD